MDLRPANPNETARLPRGAANIGRGGLSGSRNRMPTAALSGQTFNGAFVLGTENRALLSQLQFLA